MPKLKKWGFYCSVNNDRPVKNQRLKKIDADYNVLVQLNNSRFKAR
jgi:hypothetical protein